MMNFLWYLRNKHSKNNFMFFSTSRPSWHFLGKTCTCSICLILLFKYLPELYLALRVIILPPIHFSEKTKIDMMWVVTFNN